MRVLALSNFYPPFYFGGYELGCQGVMETLKSRGHEVRVLTSTYGVEKTKPTGADAAGVYRLLETPMEMGPKGPTFSLSPPAVIARERVNQEAFRRVCAEFRPDLVYAWNLTHISISLVFLARELGLPVCYFVSDPWLSQYDKDLWHNQCHYTPRSPLGYARKGLVRLASQARGVKRLPHDLGDLGGVQFASQYLKGAALEEDLPVGDARVIHWGVDLARYPHRETIRPPARLLYVGQIGPHKGVHTVIEALNLIVREPRHRRTQLTIAGGGDFFPQYVESIHSLVQTLDLETNVHFTGMLDRDALLPIYAENDILVFPSIWDEPFGITPLEAMASGLAVVGTTTGGSPEIFEHDRNALVFPKTDARQCAAQLLRLLDDPDHYEAIRRQGRRTIEERFSFTGMVDKIEAALRESVPAAS